MDECPDTPEDEPQLLFDFVHRWLSQPIMLSRAQASHLLGILRQVSPLQLSQECRGLYDQYIAELIDCGG
jgi:hypothetical protein